jgi:hypothetical protein
MDRFEPGKTISFRLPADTPLHVLEDLTERKRKLGRKFSSDIASIFVEAISQQVHNHEKYEQVIIPLPPGLTAEQKEWINHAHTKSLFSQLLYQVVNRPNTPFNFTEPENKTVPEEPKSIFKANAAIQKFAQKTFMNFDDDDD